MDIDHNKTWCEHTCQQWQPFFKTHRIILPNKTLGILVG
jgi:hypothetical protein